MVTSLLTWAVVLGSLLSWSPSEGVGDCPARPLSSKSIVLCHDSPLARPEGPYRCDSPTEGFVLMDLIIAPRSEHHECKRRSSDLLNATCLRSHVVNPAKFDAAMFDLLEKVSGKQQIDNSTVVDQLSFATSDGTEDQEKDSSEFVMFKNLCKPVRKTDQQDADGVVSMCSKNMATKSFVYLTLEGGENLTTPSATPFQCSCRLRAAKTLALRALDIRLQQAGTRRCQPGLTLKIQSGNRTKELTCDGQYAYYGLDLLFTASDVTLDLLVPAGAMPTSVWIQAEEVGSKSTDPVNVWCEDVIHLAAPKPEDKDGANWGIIVGSIVGVLVIGVVTVIVIVIIRRRRKQREFTNPEMEEHVYAEPGNPCASRSINFDFPKEDPQTPPPLPDNHPPGALPLGPAKPKRSFTYSGSAGSTSDAPGEEYNCLMLDGRKEAAGEGGRGSNGMEKSKDSYDHLNLEDKGVGSQGQVPVV